MKTILEPVELRRIENISGDEPDDVFVCCGSPEERCLGSVRRLAPDYESRAVFLIRYTDHRSSQREKNIDEMKEKLDKVGELFEFVIDEDKPIPVINEIARELYRRIDSCEAPRVSIDISTIIKWHFLIMMKALDVRGICDKIRFLYTEPKDYITDLFQPLSFGIHRIFPVPTYSGKYDLSKDILLVLLLGYEGDRALALFEEMDPTECLLFIGKPAYHDEWEGRTEIMNSGIINIVGESKIVHIDSRNPVRVYERLKSTLRSPQYSKYNHIISPLGTKPQTLGLYQYLSSNPRDTVLIYGSPLRHNEPFYSEGIGRSWLLPYAQPQGADKDESNQSLL
ncbi:MAG: hypothetical protein E3J35_09225 [Methanomassiliicoccales archaeon]|nr:MAG: hypothetical protein E3J35_09225 [Methanomassiliicoccales archaeon]